MRAYSVDLRKKIVDAAQRSRSKAEIARIFRVVISSVKRYKKMAEERGLLDPKKAPAKKRRLDESGRRLLKDYVPDQLPPRSSGPNTTLLACITVEGWSGM